MGHSTKLTPSGKSTIFLQTKLQFFFPHEMVTLTKFHDAWRNIVNFLLVANFAECPILGWSPCNTVNASFEMVFHNPCTCFNSFSTPVSSIGKGNKNLVQP